MFSVLSKLFTWNKQEAFDEIIKQYEKQQFCTINFLYLATAIMNNLFEELKQKVPNEKYEIQKLYKKNVLESDFLLPDGIGLQIFYWILKKYSKLKKKEKINIHNEYKNKNRIDNLNWTDFIPSFLENLTHKFWTQKICLILYGTYKDVIEKTEKYFSYKWFNVVYYQDGYSEFDRHQFEEKIKEYSDTINILLVSRWTPLQENRVWENLTKIQKHNLIVFTWGWLFDHLTWKQKRACKIIRILKLEWLRRLIINPKNKMQKEKIKNSFLWFKQLFRYLLLKKD